MIGLYCLIWLTRWRLRTDSRSSIRPRWASKKCQLRSMGWFTAPMKRFWKRSMSRQATETKFHGLTRLMTLDVLAKTVLLTKSWLRASPRRRQRWTERKSCRSISLSHREAQFEADMSLWARKRAISTDKRETILFRRSSPMLRSTLTGLGPKLHQRLLRVATTTAVHLN